jgi:hypothetical protein
MAISVATDFLHSSDGKIGKIQQIAGGWQSIATKSTFSNFTLNNTTKQNLSAGQFFYVLDESQLYTVSSSGFPVVTYTLISASFDDINTGSFVTNNQTSSMSVATASYVSPTFISASAAAAGFGSGGGTATDISALNTFTGSAQTSLSALNSATSSYALKTEISGAFTSVSSSISIRLTSLEAGGGNVPDGTISGSQQITDLGFINQSQTSSMSVLSAETASFISDTFISASVVRSGFGTATLPSGVVSSSAQIAVEISGAFTEASGGLAGRITTLEGTIGGDVTALNLFTSSIQTQVDNLAAETGSYLTSADTGSFILASQTSSFALNTEISGAFTQDSSSISTRLTSLEAGGGSVPAGTVSSSTQILGYNIFATTGSNTFNGTEIVSGSLNVSGSLIANGLTYPTQDGVYENQVLQTNAIGGLSFGDITTIYETIYNGEATALVKGTPVYVSGSQGASPKVFRADAGNPSKMPVTYVVAEEIQAATDGRGIVLGLISGIDLTGYTAGQDVYVAVGGGWTSTRPTGSATIQLLGVITKAGPGGQGLVLNPGVVTLPNLTAGNVWVGNNNAVPTATSTSSLNVLSAQTASYIDPTFISASAAASGFGSGGGASIPNGTISGSQQITDLGFINQSQTSSMSVLSALTASFVGNLNYDYITNLPNLISSSTQIALLGAGILSSSTQIASDISGAFTSLSSSFASRITALEGAGGGNGIFTLTGSFYSTTNNIQITGSLSVGSASFKAFEIDSDGFIILGDMDKDLNNAPEGTIAYSGSSFYLIS